MKKKSNKKLFSSFLLVALVATMVLSAVACKEEKPVSQGTTSFVLEVTDKQGEKTTFNIKTNKSSVGEALVEEGIVVGEQGPYGLYIKTVNNITCDFDTDGYYWAFYIDGEYATSGVDATAVEQGKTYELKAQK